MKERLRSLVPALDLRSLALFRMALGALIVLDIVEFRLPNLADFYSPSGIVDEATHTLLSTATSDWLNGPGPGLLGGGTSEPLTLALWLSAIPAALAFAAGWRSRLMGVLLFVVLWSINHRAPVAVEADDRMILCFLTLGLLLPLDAQFAVRPTAADSASPEVRNWASAAFALQLAAIYIPNAALKTGPIWANGTALGYAVMDPLWARPTTAGWLGGQTALCEVLSHLVRPAEAMIALFALWNFRWGRLALVAMIFGFHWGIAVFFSFGHLPHVLAVAALAFLPGSVWEKRLPIRPLTAPAPSTWFRRVHSGLGAFVLLGLLFFNVSDYLERPDWVKRLRRSPLTMQSWGLYIPDPTDEVALLKLRVIPRDGAAALDPRTGRVFTADGEGAEAYQQDQWQNLSMYIILGEPGWQVLARRWALVEYQRRQTQALRVELVSLKRKLHGPGRAAPYTAEVLASVP